MASAAVLLPNSSVCATSSAVCESSAPTRLDRLTELSNSAPLRVSGGSSLGLNPNARSTALAVELSSHTSQPNVAMKIACGTTEIRTTFIDAARAQFFGMSSPKTICENVAMMKAAVVAIPTEAARGTPVQPRSSVSSVPMLGPAMKPAMRLETVMPSWAPDRLVEVFLSERSAIVAILSPFSAADRTASRSTVRKENSTATKSALAETKRRNARSSIQAVSKMSLSRDVRK